VASQDENIQQFNSLWRSLSPVEQLPSQVERGEQDREFTLSLIEGGVIDSLSGNREERVHDISSLGNFSEDDIIIPVYRRSINEENSPVRESHLDLSEMENVD
ncbi:MAG: hypothetical protein AAGG81_02110, partial [Chlamydiota bacterium]